jgi:hypothetical protein
MWWASKLVVNPTSDLAEVEKNALRGCADAMPPDWTGEMQTVQVSTGPEAEKQFSVALGQ